jgi:hypothetical protein
MMATESPILCGRRYVTTQSGELTWHSCTEPFGHPGPHVSGPYVWTERTDNPHLWMVE